MYSTDRQVLISGTTRCGIRWRECMKKYIVFQWGHYKDIEWDNSARVTKCYILPNTRKANRRDRFADIRRFVFGDHLANCS
jgi:hypothetical protein